MFPARLLCLALLAIAPSLSLAQPVSAQEVAPISFRAAAPDVTLHIRTGTIAVPYMMGDGRGGAVSGIERRGVYQRLCTAPCELMLRIGRHQLALSSGVGGEQDVGELVSVTGPSTLHGEYVSRREARIAGWVTLVLGAIGGIAMIVAGVALPLFDSTRVLEFRDSHYALLIGGGVVLALGVSIGLGVGLLRDSVSIRVGPQD